MNTIALTGGGTAGHVIPNLALCPKLKKYYDNIAYIGSYNGVERKLVNTYGLKYYAITTCKFNRSKMLSNFNIPFQLYHGVKEAKEVLTQLKPNVVFSKGGYVSLPTALACKSLSIPLIIHESDLTLGLANKVASRCASKILTTFPDTAKSLKKGQYVGPPIRQELFEGDPILARRLYGFSGEKPVLLVIGGSLGSLAINKALYSAIDDLLPMFDVLHVTGKGKGISTQNSGYKSIEYAQDMASVYAACDIAISRCGSNTACELILLKKPTLFIPLPKGNSRGDQIQNAEWFFKKGVCSLLQESQLTAQSLITSVTSLYANRYNIRNNITGKLLKTGNDEIIALLNKYAVH